MGSIMSSIRDDENDWDDFRRKTGLDTNWEVYSREAEYARDIHKERGYTGRELKLAVRHLVEMNDLRIKQANEWKELLQLQTLEEKYV